MKKFVIGCVMVLALLAVAGGLTGYFVVVKPMWSTGKEIVHFAQEFEKLDKQIEQRGPYTPPASGALDAEQFQRFLVAQRDMRSVIGEDLKEYEAFFQSLDGKLNELDGLAAVKEVFSGYRGMADLVLSVKRARVEALNRYSFSEQEFAWVRDQAYRALGQEALAMAQEYGADASAINAGSSVPPETLEMVRPHRQELLEAAALIWFSF